MKKINQRDVNVIYSEVFKLMSRLCRDHEPLAVSGVMLAQALRLYKTTLPVDAFESLMEEIMETVKDDVRPFDIPTLN
jgi:type II secretory pathway component PulF